MYSVRSYHLQTLILCKNVGSILTNFSSCTQVGGRQIKDKTTATEISVQTISATNRCYCQRGVYDPDDKSIRITNLCSAIKNTVSLIVHALELLPLDGGGATQRKLISLIECVHCCLYCCL